MKLFNTVPSRVETLLRCYPIKYLLSVYSVTKELFFILSSVLCPNSFCYRWGQNRRAGVVPLKASGWCPHCYTSDYEAMKQLQHKET